MLKRNKILYLGLLIFVAGIFESCEYQEHGGNFGIGCILLYDNDNNIESDKIQIHECEMHYSDFESKSEEVENIKTLENVACSLRSDSISDGDILASTKSRDDGHVVFCLVEFERMLKWNEDYLLQNFSEQKKRYEDGKIVFYIIINDPDLEGYDDKYETLTLSCPYDADYKKIYLGKKS